MHREVHFQLVALLGSDLKYYRLENILLFIRKITSSSALSAAWVLQSVSISSHKHQPNSAGVSQQQNSKSPLAFVAICSPQQTPAAYLKPCLKSDFPQTIPSFAHCLPLLSNNGKLTINVFSCQTLHTGGVWDRTLEVTALRTHHFKLC